MAYSKHLKALLILLCESMPITHVAKEYGVSDKSLRSWKKGMEKDLEMSDLVEKKRKKLKIIAESKGVITESKIEVIQDRKKENVRDVIRDTKIEIILAIKRAAETLDSNDPSTPLALSKALEAIQDTHVSDVAISIEERRAELEEKKASAQMEGLGLIID